MTERDARAGDLAENGDGAGQLRDERGLAKSHLAHPLAKGVVPREGVHAADRAGGKLAERKKRIERRVAHA